MSHRPMKELQEALGECIAKRGELESTVSQLRSALEPFAAMWDYFAEELDGAESADVNPYDYRSAKSGDCRKAREALSTQGAEGIE